MTRRRAPRRADFVTVRLPATARITLPIEELELLLRAAGGREIPLNPARPSMEARAAFLTPRELYAAGRGEVSVREAAWLVGVTRRAMLAAVRRGAVRARRIGSMYGVDVRSLRAYVAVRRVPRAAVRARRK